MSENVRLEPGAVAPAFSLPNDAGETTSLADYAGERVIVYFYPKANTAAQRRRVIFGIRWHS